MKRRYPSLVILVLLFAVSCVVPFEKSVFEGEFYSAPNGSVRWDIYYPAYSNGWSVDVNLTGQGGTFDLVIASGMLDWEDYVIKLEDPAYPVFHESFNVSEVSTIIEMNLSPSRTVRILFRTHENGVILTGYITGRCLAFRYAGWGMVNEYG
ncbi:MAG: hypothetical protein ACXADC_10555 [Candidatus Thorarchaeota archaeon]